MLWHQINIATLLTSFLFKKTPKLKKSEKRLIKARNLKKQKGENKKEDLVHRRKGASLEKIQVTY
ncbi:hypothetical protein NQ317_017227 [Molorchus minor]|uniref:Uncharacterized protein n=1 Tax=Molorchus minor TaxID=1323400 RepID=A0ABQ9JFS1_9CUCU|nr:hypothetical protein NQ317_017227 [Molorchus minor]